jgi:hypothetical protein
VSDELFFAVVPGRLEALRDLCRANGAELILATAPVPRKFEDGTRLRRAAERYGIRVAVGFTPGEFMAPRDYSDGWHMNTAASLRYTARLLSELKRILGVS